MNTRIHRPYFIAAVLSIHFHAVPAIKIPGRFSLRNGLSKWHTNHVRGHHLNSSPRGHHLSSSSRGHPNEPFKTEYYLNRHQGSNEKSVSLITAPISPQNLLQGIINVDSCKTLQESSTPFQINAAKQRCKSAFESLQSLPDRRKSDCRRARSPGCYVVNVRTSRQVCRVAIPRFGCRRIMYGSTKYVDLVDCIR